ncbi:hypothetical protein [Vogesella indigofera]|uniref:hypothetical protein n=1 Tax=Vogesella indigofera TaxID=45465 RepID=UPI00234EFBCD|nr:hypothetical protein [Vogesella indigofera]MDC7696303.1 hypothetical protein [Vogesella indigofera]
MAPYKTVQSAALSGRGVHLAGAAAGTATGQARLDAARYRPVVPSYGGSHCLPDGDRAHPLRTWLKCALRKALNTGYFLCRKLYCLLRVVGIFNINKLFDFHELATKINLSLQQCGGGGPGRGGGGLAIAADYKAIIRGSEPWEAVSQLRVCCA